MDSSFLNFPTVHEPYPSDMSGWFILLSELENSIQVGRGGKLLFCLVVGSEEPNKRYIYKLPYVGRGLKRDYCRGNHKSKIISQSAIGSTQYSLLKGSQHFIRKTNSIQYCQSCLTVFNIFTGSIRVLFVNNSLTLLVIPCKKSSKLTPKKCIQLAWLIKSFYLLFQNHFSVFRPLPSRRDEDKDRSSCTTSIESFLKSESISLSSTVRQYLSYGLQTAIPLFFLRGRAVYSISSASVPTTVVNTAPINSVQGFAPHRNPLPVRSGSGRHVGRGRQLLCRTDQSLPRCLDFLPDPHNISFLSYS